MDELPLRRGILEQLRDMNHRQSRTGDILTFDLDHAAAALGVEREDVQNALADLLTEGLVEGYAETFGKGAADGACRITAEGLRHLRGQ